MIMFDLTGKVRQVWPGMALVAAFGGLFCGVCPVSAADAPAAPDSSSLLPQKPAWLSEASVGVKESFDDNVFMSGVNQSAVPAGTTTMKDRSSFITTVSPKAGFDFTRAANANTNGVLELLSLTYAPDFVLYHGLSSESYDAHRANLAVKGKADDFSFNLDSSTWYVDGSTQGPAYPGDLLNAWATINAYQRREQLEDRTKLTLQYDWNQWFIRPGATLAYYGMMSDIKNPSLASTPDGYQNYCTRYDVNGGFDLGYKFCPQMDVTLGYRYGAQDQQQYSFSPYSSPSDYQRLLAGLEGKPFSWLNMQLLGGPDFRSYENDSATHISPLNNLHPMTYYGEAALTATITPKDMLTFKYRQFQFVSCLGKVPYFDSSYDLSYRRKITDRLSFDAGARLLEADYTEANLTACQRNDYDYVLVTGLHYAFSANLAADLGYQADLGRNSLDIPNSSTRNFDSQLISLGFQFKL
jgi:opacity protein-like surface antigen